MLGIALTGCATHPTISPVPLKQGESYYGYTLSAENVLPLVFFRRGLTDKWDLGLRLGLPIYGSGIDISRLLVDKGNRSDILNLAYSFNPNHNIDYTYYRVVRKTKVNEKNNTTRQKLRYYGLRGMLILNGISGRRSHRFGILIGGAPAIKWGAGETPRRFYRFQWELGYFHDFDSMPIIELFNPRSFDHTRDPRFENFPHTVNGLPSEHSRLTGLSLRLSFPLVKSVASLTTIGEEP
ncbi:MAG: hypothetical protein IIB42_06490 [Candidatus Marinimicrobia bacterium]|nr:hypothetical protein [Candidatus Neomarinimicrobiota bacterium]